MIDRAAAAVVRQATADGGKHAGSLVGHASIGGVGPRVMPAAPPTSLAFHQNPAPATNVGHGLMPAAGPSVRQHTAPQIAMTGQANVLHSAPQHGSMEPLYTQQMQQMQIQQQLQQMQQMQHMQQQQQQQQQMMQQMQHAQQMQNKQYQQTIDETTQDGTSQEEEEEVDVAPGKIDSETQQDDAHTLDNWYEGLDDEFNNLSVEDWEAVHAATNNDAVNLASSLAHDDLNEQVHPYEFVHVADKSFRDNRNKNNTDWMAKGLEAYERGDISEAVQAFETVAQIDDDNSKAWYFLGKCHAENDQDPWAIACLERAVERDPYSTEALLALGVSYVNELNHTKALQNLREWITNNPDFAGLEGGAEIYGPADENAGDGVAESNSEIQQVQDLLLRALEHRATPEVHEAIGVVYNVSRDYDAAASSFRAAIQERPRDHSLWNKLGATLANSNLSDEALPAYHEALRSRPKYARAWLNMAISHSNLSNYDEAARCYLQTIALNPSATHCWSYLRIALSCLEKWDLLPFVASQDLEAFREHYDFVEALPST